MANDFQNFISILSLDETKITASRWTNIKKTLFELLENPGPENDLLVSEGSLNESHDYRHLQGLTQAVMEALRRIPQNTTSYQEFADNPEEARVTLNDDCDLIIPAAYIMDQLYGS